MGHAENLAANPSDLVFTELNFQHFDYFIKALTRHDRMHGPDTVVLFQAIAESGEHLDKLKYIPALARQLDEVWSHLVELNTRGYSIHWALHEYGYMGQLPPTRRREHVTRIRHFAVDIDRPIPLPLVKKLVDTFYPSAVVLSSKKDICLEDSTDIETNLLLRHFHPGFETDENGYNWSELYKVHFYWQISNRFGNTYKEELDPPLTAEELSLKDNWHLFQTALAFKVDDTINDELGIPTADRKEWTDKGLRALSQTLRVPGFYHIKDPENPFCTQQFHSNTDNVITPALLPKWLGVLGITSDTIHYAEQRFQEKKRGNKKFTAREDTEDTSEPAPYDESGYWGADAGGRNNSLFRYACHLFFKRRLKKSEVLAICVSENSAKNNPPLDQFEVNDIVDSAYQEFLSSQEKVETNRIAHGDSASAVTAQERMQKYIESQLKHDNVVGAAAGVSPNQLISKAESVAFDPIFCGDLDYSQQWDHNVRAKYDYSSNHFAHLTSDIAVAERVTQRFNGQIRRFPNGELWVWNKEKGIWVENVSRINTAIGICGTDTGHEPGVHQLCTKDNGGFDKKQLATLKNNLHSNKRIRAVYNVLQGTEDIQTEQSAIDSNWRLFNCKNGIVDITSGEVFEHAPEYLMTLCSNVILQTGIRRDIDDYCWLTEKEFLKTNRFTKFIYEIMERDLEMCYYLQKICGYILEAGNPHELMFFFYGAGNNGKSLLTNSLSKLLGSYTYTVPSDVFLQGGKDRANILSQLANKRFVLTSELGGGKRWSEESIKDVTGADEINVRPLYKESFNYKPMYKVIVRGNNKPKIGGTDYGVWRRIRPVPFDRVFYPHEVDRNLPALFTSEEYAYQIFAWAIAGNSMYQEEGLTPPERAAEAYVEYRNQTMPVLGFIKDVVNLEASKLSLGQLETGVYPTDHVVEPTIVNGSTSEVLPMEFADLVDAAKLHRLYMAWIAHKKSMQMTEVEVFEAVEALGVRKMRVTMRSETQIDKHPRVHWILGLRIKSEWLAKASSGRAIYGHADTTGSVLRQ